MRPFQFVHTADLHLESPFAGWSDSAPTHVRSALLEATSGTYQRIIELCIEAGVDALLIAGDVYDGADRSLRAQLTFRDGLRRVSAAGIRSFVCHGNHDPLDGWEANIAFPPECTRFGPTVSAVALDPDREDEVVVHGYSYPRRNVQENVTQLFRRAPCQFAIGLLHCNAGSSTGHAPYAPCSVEDLARAGMDYWALGHVHTRRVLRAARPVIVYPGNPQGRHANEPGERGAYLVDVDAQGQVRLEFRALDRIRWETLHVDIGGLTTHDDLEETIGSEIEAALACAGGRPVVFRLEVAGRGELHPALAREGYIADLREALNEEWGTREPFAWCEGIVDLTAARFDRGEALQAGDFVAELLGQFDRVRSDGDALAQLREGLRELYRRGPLRRYLGEPPGDEEMRALLTRAEALCIDRLVDVEER